ncbi:molybdenum cofactor guanylyltransferase [Psychrobacter sp. M13]|uniref:molybdenum cofactor guanylyltransferase n=1 Tax=Psychrobacter sp. M13 TaxID=3067275 RepID=UPI00273CF114|nr:molybdenum cofactor guanylyltransferase [Psychrobacter sp. M13]WLP93917.1 molybdenum cofactor guanylyltransferase [Psychrobacter sp. M13]
MSNNLDSSDSLSKLAGVVILAGGASQRMGSPKALLTLPTGERLLDYHVRQAAQLNVPIMIADNGREFAVDVKLLASNPELSITQIDDYQSISIVDNDKAEATQGPLVAIESALQNLNNARDANLEHKQLWLMVISCDSLINANELWQQLSPYIDNNNIDKSIVCLTDQDHLYPLLGLYRLSIEPALRAYIDSGERKVMSFIKPIAQTVPVLENQQLLTNFNTPTDFKRACSALYDL